jgi:hypothetical protein
VCPKELSYAHELQSAFFLYIITLNMYLPDAVFTVTYIMFCCLPSVLFIIGTLTVLCLVYYYMFYRKYIVVEGLELVL